MAVFTGAAPYNPVGTTFQWFCPLDNIQYLPVLIRRNNILRINTYIDTVGTEKAYSGNKHAFV